MSRMPKLINPAVEGLDWFDPELTEEQKKAIGEESRANPDYYAYMLMGKDWWTADGRFRLATFLGKTYAGWRHFIMLQPADKPINHGCWGKCSVGEYVNGYSSEDGPEHCAALRFVNEFFPQDVKEMLYTKRPKDYGKLYEEMVKINAIPPAYYMG